MNTNMNANYQQSPNQPHIEYDNIDKMNMQAVREAMDSQKFGKQRSRRKGKNDWLTPVIALAICAAVACVLFFVLK